MTLVSTLRSSTLLSPSNELEKEPKKLGDVREKGLDEKFIARSARLVTTIVWLCSVIVKGTWEEG